LCICLLQRVARALVAEAFAAGFLPPVIPSLGCGPFGTVLVWMVEPVFSLFIGFLRVPVSVFCVVFCFLCSIIGPTSCGEGESSTTIWFEPDHSTHWTSFLFHHCRCCCLFNIKLYTSQICDIITYYITDVKLIRC